MRTNAQDLLASFARVPIFSVLIKQYIYIMFPTGRFVSLKQQNQMQYHHYLNCSSNSIDLHQLIIFEYSRRETALPHLVTYGISVFSMD